MFKNPILRLYLLSGIVFIIAITQCFSNREAKFFVLEFLSFGVFIFIVYLFDRNIRDSINKESKYKADSAEREKKLKEKIEGLENEIDILLNKDETRINSDDNIKKVIKSITDNISSNLNVEDFFKELLLNLSIKFEVGLGICYLYDEPSQKYVVKSNFGVGNDINSQSFANGEGINGQAVINKQIMEINDIDEEYFNIESCTGTAKPKNIYLLPIIKADECVGLIEIASFKKLRIEKYWEYLSNYIVDTLSL